MQGNIINRIAEASHFDGTIEVGTGATLLMWSDRVPFVITGIVRFKTGARAGQIKAVDARKVEVDAEPFPSGYAKKIHLDRPYGNTERFSIRKDGCFRDTSTARLIVGRADYYRDPSF